MVRNISARDARANFSDLLGSVFYTNEPVIVERKGKPFAVVISPEQFRVMQAELGTAWHSVDDVRAENRDVPAQQVLNDITNEVESVRQEMYAERSHPKSHP